uniref:Uncharacterized protein n=1 Tax=Knipowitschia caucasica TaxID=637954 RepID=A0AAV2JZ56_KNICA
MGFEKGRCHCGRFAKEDREQPQSPGLQQQRRPKRQCEPEQAIVTYRFDIKAGSGACAESHKSHVMGSSEELGHMADQ